MKITRKDLNELRLIIRPAILSLVFMIFSSFGVGFLIMKLSGFDYVTAVLAVIPGGIADVAIIGEDLGADVPPLVVLHIIRYLTGILIFPQLALRICRRYAPDSLEDAVTPHAGTGAARTWKDAVITLLLAMAAALAGQYSGLPSGALVFAIIAVSIRNVGTQRNYLPRQMRYAAQCCAGIYIGVGITRETLSQFRNLGAAALLTIFYCILIHYGIGFLLYRFSKLNLSTCLFGTIPSGLSDMALISMELGGDAPKVTVLHLVRYLCAVLLMPLLIPLFQRLLAA